MLGFDRHFVLHLPESRKAASRARSMGAMQMLPVILTFLIYLCPEVNCDLPDSPSTSLISEDTSHLLILSTLDGSLIGIESETGHIKWKLQNEPAVKVSVGTSKSVVPLFLPDPKDGSLYVLGGPGTDALKKLPFTIPQLVASSPCRSSDGILYSGRKMDTWFSIDVKKGKKVSFYNFDKDDPMCPLGTGSESPVFVGRSEFNIYMMDSKRKNRKWNVTFYDYSSTAMDSESLSKYGLVHFMGSSSGRVLTVDRRQGHRKWSFDYGSPVIGVYIMNSEGFISCPFTTVAEDTLDQLIEQLRKSPLDSWFASGGLKLQPTLYVGEHQHGFYALPSLVDGTVMTIGGKNDKMLLLEGPTVHGEDREPGEENAIISRQLEDLISMYKAESSVESYPIIVLGYYKMPKNSETQLQISGNSRAIVPTSRFVYTENSGEDNSKGVLNSSARKYVTLRAGDHSSNVAESCWEKISKGKISEFLSSDCLNVAYGASKTWFIQQENKALKLVLASIIIGMAMLFMYVRGQMREFQQFSQGSRQGSSGSSPSEITAHSVVASDGGTHVGKIIFYTSEVLGKGCEGTFVYRGSFDGRSVAVKRLLPGCFSLADREVALLRESDQHAHVVRYFCTEQDNLFRYIALELAVATVADLVEGRVPSGAPPLPSSLTTTEIMRQAIMGLSHLHSLDIVHRDIKPHNVLLSMPNARGEVRAMISDFGLCKKLQTGRMSFSRRSGITGTDGWIAPEMLAGGRTTCAVDIFSMGCVLYYVKTKGKHPFGDTLRRQSNILNGDYKLNEFGEPYAEAVLVNTLVERMLSLEPLERPPAAAVLSHPLFWDPAKIMCFFQDVSDRVEKDEQETSESLQALETNASLVVRTDWRIHICDEVAQDLRRYRNYRGQSVRDLLRALRNKKHHYRELSVEAQRSLGAVPEQFVHYWMNRFPRLLLHSWLTMQLVRSEPVFQRYYHPTYFYSKSELDFPRDEPGGPSGHEYNTANWILLERNDAPNSPPKSPHSPKKSPAKSKKTNKSDNWRDRRRRDLSEAQPLSEPNKQNWRKKTADSESPPADNRYSQDTPGPDGTQGHKTEPSRTKDD